MGPCGLLINREGQTRGEWEWNSLYAVRCVNSLFHLIQCTVGNHSLALSPTDKGEYLNSKAPNRSPTQITCVCSQWSKASIFDDTFFSLL